MLRLRESVCRAGRGRLIVPMLGGINGTIRFATFHTPLCTREFAVVIRQLVKFRGHGPVAAAIGEAAATDCVPKKFFCFRHDVSPRGIRAATIPPEPSGSCIVAPAA
jgi:hypothetical protein